MEDNGYSVYLQAWDIAPGDDFIERMNDFLEHSKGYIPIISKTFKGSEYCMKEFQTAFNAHMNHDIEKFIPIRIEDVSLGPLYRTTVYVNIFDLGEVEARTELLNSIGNTVNPRKKGKFPGNCDNRDDLITFRQSNFPGRSVHNNMKVKEIILLENDKNKKGDLFNRMVYEVFHALGFGDAQFNISKNGREIDMILQHRTENKIALVESKSHNKPIGGADINKFIGAFDVEKHQYIDKGKNVVGYFISKSGFTSTALAQEEEERTNGQSSSHSRQELVLLGPNDIVRELIQGNVICSIEKAVDAARKNVGETLTLCENIDLIACNYGWIWVVYYSEFHNQVATHCTFVHADGNVLLNNIASDIIKKAQSTNLIFSKLLYINRIDVTLDKKAAKDAYFKYIENELGEIQFEGMPTDKEAGSVKVNLESIYVPLRFTYNDRNSGEEYSQLDISQVLRRNKRVAILAKPGGGKSTLIRRIALSYAYPERRKKIKDGLPEEDWFPIYIRCRDLGEDAQKSILDIIYSIVRRAEIIKHKDAFESLVEDALQDGRTLLLIDGLDEITTEKNRIFFVHQLRTFISTYPNVRLIITSRETGFRAVAGVIISYCEPYSIDNLRNNEISSLCLKWHKALLGDSTDAVQASNDVCNVILHDSRIITLAENPLLLTTLLFVKRWIGYIPTKKCRLYEEMIKLLLVTWNAIAHDGLDMDETEPQLAFIAYYMTSIGEKKITRRILKQCIQESRKELPEILSYTTVSPNKFIDQVEDRSSLLIQIGLEEDEMGNLVPAYEFSHLNFQEYLTAKAISEKWIPNSYESEILEILKPHINEENWKEVIPLAAVLLGRKARPLIEYLIKTYNEYDDLSNRHDVDDSMAPLHLANFIASEVPMSRDILEKAIIIAVKGRELDEKSTSVVSEEIYSTILNSKYRKIYADVVEQYLYNNITDKYIDAFSSAWLEIYLSTQDDVLNLNHILNLLESGQYKDNITGALLMMQFTFQKIFDKQEALGLTQNQELINNIFFAIYQLINKSDYLSQYVAEWCIAWSGYNERDIIPDVLTLPIANRLVDLWINSDSAPYVLRRMLSWCICSVSSPKLRGKIYIKKGDFVPTMEQCYINPSTEFDVSAAINIALLMNVWSIDDAKKNIRKKTHFRKESSRFWQQIGLR